MERKLEPKDIVGYFSHRPMFMNNNRQYQYLEIFNIPYIVNLFENNREFIELTKLKIVLRPLSDLYKTITHNGEDFAPIVELAKIHGRNPKVKWWLNAVNDAECLNFIFGYNAEANSFYCGLNDVDASHCLVWNQYQLFDKLNEWKIDYRGLIERGFAIDVNKLDINPYK